MRLLRESPISCGACGVSARIAARNGARPISAGMRSSHWTAFSAIHTWRCTPAAVDHPSVASSDPMAQKSRNIELTQVIEWQDGKAARVDDYLAAEEPLRMPSDTAPERNLVRVTLDSSVRLAANSAARRFSAGSACGVCGKASITQLRRRGLRRPETATLFDPELLCQLPPRLREAQAVFGRTGGLHAAALFGPTGELLVLREDIGRHNAVDKTIGWALLGGRLPLTGHVLLVSGRGGFEIVQKTITAGIPLLASVSAPSSLAVQLARELGLTLVGFLRGRRFVIYAGEERIAVSASAPAGAS